MDMIIKILIIYACIAWVFDLTFGLIAIDDNASWSTIIIQLVFMPFIVIYTICAILVEDIRSKT